jgi:GTPase SAR1 family protein
MAKIIVDTPTTKGLGFQDYAEALVNIILDSGSPFTIGILGDWGVGKTSLMQTMCAKLREQSDKGVIPVWFNAWRCEQEQYFAIVPLLELLVSELAEGDLKKKFVEFLMSIQLKFCVGPAEVSAGGGSQNQFEEQLYYDKLAAIKTTLEQNSKKIVVFIDDLDRCAPDKILEVLESTTVFLDIKGFVYVLGMNSEVVNKAIDQKYKDMGIKGEDYLEKIIQIPFKVPDWIDIDLGEYLDYLIENEIDPDYQETFKEYKDIVLKIIEKTPRQVKRFINTYISEHEVFKGKELDKTIHLILTILKFKWYGFYHDLFYESYRNYLKKLLEDDNKLKEEFKDKKDLVDFISERKVRETIDTILGMNDGELLEYRRAGISIPQKIIKPAIDKENLLELLRTRKIAEFNDLTKELEIIDLSGAYLGGANLIGADLNKANLRGAYLRKANLNGADLSGADLMRVNLGLADLRGAYLRGAYLREAYLIGADLRKSDLRGAYLIGADLRKSDLRGAYLIEGIILVKGPFYHETKVAGADFENAILIDSEFVAYVRANGAQNVPDAITDKNQIINLLKKRGYDVSVIERVKEFLEL